MKRTHLFVSAALLSAALLLAGCGGAQTAGKDSAQVREPVAPGLTVVTYGEWEKGAKGGRIVIGQLGQGPKTFNLVLAEETSSTDITNRLSGQLVRRNQFTLEFEPFMAESWQISEDQKSVTVKIRKDMKWSDGAPITSKDWVDGINKIIYNEGIQTSARDSFTVADELAVWEYIDDYTLKVSVKEVYAGLIQMLNTAPIPMHIMGPVLEASGADGINTMWGVDTDVTKIPSSGAFLIKEFVPSQRITLVPNPNYFEKDEAGVQLPYLDELVFNFTPDQDTMLQNFLAGTTDYLAVRGADYKTVLEKKDVNGFTIYEVGPATSTNFVAFNMNPKGPATKDADGNDVPDNGIDEPQLTWLNNVKFRTAIAHLVDRETLINNVEFGFGYPQYSFVPRFSPYYWAGVDEAAIKYDPVAAGEILDGLGYKDSDGDGIREDDKGNPLVLTLETNAGNRAREAIGTALVQEALNVGIKIDFKPVDFNVLVGKLTETYDWNLIIIGLTGDIDPISGANVYPSTGNLHMNEPNQTTPRRDWEKAVDDAWKEANNTTDEAQRVSGWEKIQRIWASELPWTYTYNVLVMEAYKSTFGNIKPQPTSGYAWDGIIHRIYVKPAK